MTEKAVRVAVPTGYTRSISARVLLQRSAVAVICAHPWGPLGGSMHDIVVQSTLRTFAEAGLTTLRFNFRSGIGRGNQSADDVFFMARYLLEELPEEERPTQLIICGYSYGSIPAAAAVMEVPEAIGFVVIAPPLDYASALYLFNQEALLARACDDTTNAGKPRMLLIGDRDNFCSMETFQALAERMPGPKTVRVVAGYDHFQIYAAVPQQVRQWALSAFGLASLEELATRAPPPADGPPAVAADADGAAGSTRGDGAAEKEGGEL